jgi:hypothetical protein
MRTDFSIKLGLFLLALILICSARACAQELTHKGQCLHTANGVWKFNPCPHKTFNRTFDLEMGLAGISLAADGFTTEKNNRPHWHEVNPVLSSRTPAKTSVYFSAMFSGLIYSNHLLRNHPRLRHVLNFSVIGLESYWSVSNAIQPRKIVR